jgi:hypothetical protein
MEDKGVWVDRIENNPNKISANVISRNVTINLEKLWWFVSAMHLPFYTDSI